MIEFTNLVLHQHIQRRYDDCDASLQRTLCGIHEIEDIAQQMKYEEFPNPVVKTPNKSFLKRATPSIICFCSALTENLFWPLSKQILNLCPVRPPHCLVCKEYALWGLHSQILATCAQSSPELTQRKQRKHGGRERINGRKGNQTMTIYVNIRVG